MFGGTGAFSDDILSSFITANTKSNPPKRSQTVNLGEPKHLLSAPKQYKDIDDDSSDSPKKNPVGKLTSGLAQTHVIKKSPAQKETTDTVDDLLNTINDAIKPTGKQDKPPRPATSQGFDKSGKGLLDDLAGDEDEDFFGGYNPTVTRDKKRPGTSMGLSEDLKSKRKDLFGLVNQSGTSSTDADYKQRPQTTESKTITTNIDDFGEINITASRRNKNRAQTNIVNQRPFTSPGILENKDSALSVDDNKSMTDLGGQITPAEFRNYGDDDDAASTSEYLAQIGKRDKKPTTNQPRIKLDAQSDVGDGRRADNTPKKSPMSVHENFSTKDSFFPGEERKEAKHSGILGRKELLDPNTSNKANEFTPNIETVSRRGNRTETKKLDVINKTDEIKPFTPAADSIVTGRHDSQINIIPVNDPAMKSFYKDNEDLYKRRIKETEEYYEQRFQQLKSSLEEEKKKWDDAHQREIEHLKKEREDLKEGLNTNIDRERIRLQELHKLEIESKEKLHKYELERQRHIFEDQSEGLKRQLEAQIKLNSLAEEIRVSSTKINALSDKLEQDKIIDEEKKRMDLFNKEKHLEERERKIMHEREMLDAERRRLDKVKGDYEQKELEIQKNLEKERELIKNEYNRLTELQESIRNMENDKKKDLELERKAYDYKKANIDKEIISIKEEYNKKYHDLELQTEIFETRKRETEEMLEKSEDALKRKHEEIDHVRKRLALSEADLIRKIKNLEQKELLISKQADDLQTKIDLFQMERLHFEKEKIQVQEIASKVKEETEVVNKFKREFDTEKEKNSRVKLELDRYAANIQNEKKRIEEEKSNLSMMHKTVEGLRYNYVKDLSTNLERPASAATLIGTKDGFNIQHKRAGSVMGETDERSKETNGFEVKARGTYNGNSRTETSDRFVLLKDVKKTDHNKSEIDPARLTTFKPFNLKGYMDQLKQFDKYTSTNQTYITLEKEGLLKNKLEIETGHLTRLRSLNGTDFGTRSPRFKTNLFSSELDSL